MNTTILPFQSKRERNERERIVTKATMPGLSSLLLVLLPCLFSLQQASAQTVITNPTSPFVVPAGVTNITVHAIGAGGSGGGATGTITASRGGGGGGGGAYSTGVLTVTGGQSITTTVGAAGSTGSGAGGAGGNSSFGSVVANGGGGGAANNGAGGAGGTGTRNGGAGGTGNANNGAAGGGGAGSTGAGGTATTTVAGTGGTGVGNLAGGAGAAVRTSTGGSGNTGNVPGGGGSGGRGAAFFGSADGGAGGAGRVVISYNCPVYTLDNPTVAATPICANGTSQVILSSSAAGLPTGTYTVTYNRSAPNAATGVTVSMTVATAGSGSFVTAALPNPGTTTITITNLSSGNQSACSNAITSNNTADITVNPPPSITLGTINSICAGSTSFSIPYTSLGTGTDTYSLSGTNIVAISNATFDPAPGTIAVNLASGASGTTIPFVLTLKNSVTGCTSTVNGSVTVNALPQGSLSGGTICDGSTGFLTFTATAGTGPYTVVYNDGTADQTVLNVISGTAFAVATNPTSTQAYSLVSVTGSNGCVRSSGFTGSSATITVRALPTGSIAGSTTVCQNSSAPNLVFTNPQSLAVTFTYTINSGSNLTINVPASGSANLPAPTTAAGSFVYDLVNVFYTAAPGCVTPVSGSATVEVLPAPTAYTVGGGGAYCADLNGVSITLSNSDAGFDYQLLNGSTPVLTLAGTGSALSYDNIVAAGIYSILATNTTTLCTRTMTGTVAVSINPVPTINSVTASPATICLGSVTTLTAATTAVSDLLTLGAGSSTTVGNSTSNTLGPNPLQNYYGGAKQHMLIRASELTAMGLSAGSQISALQIQLAAANTGYALQNFEVKMQHTTLNALTATFTTAGFSNVFGPANYTPTGTGFNNINFSSSFTWNGTSNILIETTFSNNNSGSGTVNTAVYGATSFVSTAFYRVDLTSAATVEARTTATYTYSSRNNIKLLGTVFPDVTWTPATELYTNAGTTTAYSGQETPTVYAKPSSSVTYTATATNKFGCNTDGTVSITVNEPPVITTSPTAQVACEGTSASFTVAATGTGVTYQWRRGTTNLVDGGAISGATSNTLTINPVAVSDGGNDYNVVVSGTAPCTPVTSANVGLTVNTAPTVTCPADVVTNTDAGVCFASRSFTASATGSPSPNVAYSINGTFINFPYDFPVGTTVVTVLAEGACAPDATCSFNVTVNDLQGPAPDLASLPVINGECSATVTVTPTATDACDGPIIATTSDPLTYNTQGSFNITWTYTDTKGNTTTQVQQVVVDDITAPLADLASLPDQTGECSVTVSATPTATDNCVGAVVGTTNDPLTYTTQGTYTITWSFDDGNGNVSTQTQTVIVDDITAPVADVASLPELSGECTVTATAPTATDNCVGTVVATTTDPVSYTTQGTYSITWTYDDGNGNTSTQTQTVVVDDITAPVADVTALPSITAECSVTVTAPTATDNCVGTVTASTTDPVTYNTQGTFVINWVYDDGNGNTSSQSQTVIIDDITAPVADISSLPNATGECSVTVVAPTATDNCVGVVTATTNDPLTYSTQGTFIINWSYDDGNGNVSTQTQTVIVDDITAPVADIATLPTLTGECSVEVLTTPTATDACVGAVAGTTTDALTYNAQGTYTITWTFGDGNGNASTQTQTVIVNDVTPPSITCASSQAFCSVPGGNYIIPALIATDNCTITSVSYAISGSTTRSGTGNDASGLFNVGVSTIIWTVVDGNNNSSTCSTTVAINIAPEAPAAINGFTNACPYIGTGEQVTYSVDPVPFATGYEWTLPSTMTLVSGQGTSSITVTINSDFNSNPSPVTRLLRVKSTSDCGNSTDRLLYLLAQYPVTPGAISGPTNVCALIGTTNTATYTINKVTAATSYAWTTQAGTTSVVHPNGPGVNDTVIVVTFDAGFSSSPITVTAVNGCGTSGSVRSLFIPRTASSRPSLIAGPINVCANILPSGSAAAYTIPAVTNATSYNWTVPPNAVVSHPNGAGVNDTTILVQFPAGFTIGVISVSSTNGCGTSAIRSLSVTRLNPATPGVIDVIQTASCPDRAYSYTVAAMPANSTSLQWTIPASGTIISQTATSITVSYPGSATSGVVTVQSFNNCGSSTIRSTEVKLPGCAIDFTKDAGKASTVVAEELPDLTVKVFPNPTVSDFKVQVLSQAKEKVQVRILDMQGREFKRLNVQPNQTLTIGAELKAGAYLVETRQGGVVKTTKVIKF